MPYPSTLPAAMMDTFIPARTPSGRPLRRAGPPSESALVWLSADPSPKIRAFIHTAEAVLA